MYQMHNSLISGHLGKKKTREKTLQRFYWFGLREDMNVGLLVAMNVEQSRGLQNMLRHLLAACQWELHWIG